MADHESVRTSSAQDLLFICLSPTLQGGVFFFLSFSVIGESERGRARGYLHKQTGVFSFTSL